MLKYLGLALICGYRILWDYFTWMLRYSNHPEKYPIEKRYKKARSLITFVFKHWKARPTITNLDYLNKQEKCFIALCNHRVAIDPLMIICLSEKPLSFVAKDKIRKYPFVGRILRSIDGKFIDRDNVLSQVATFRDIAKAVKENKLSYLIFPEGTRNKDLNGPLLPFHIGTTKTALWAECDIVMCVMCGTENMQSGKIVYKEYPVEIEFLEPLRYDDFKGKTTAEITPMCEDLMNKKLISVRSRNYDKVSKVLP